MTSAWGDPLDERSLDEGPALGRAAINRLALRAVRRDLRRSVLIALLLALPVAVAIVVAAGQRVVWPDRDELRTIASGSADVQVWFGLALGEDGSIADADVLVQNWGLTPEDAKEIAPLLSRLREAGPDQISDALARSFGNARVLPIRTTTVGLVGRHTRIESFDLTDPIADGMVSLERGRAPQVGEVAISPALADLFDAGIGDTIELGKRGELVVSGIARLRSDHRGQTAIVAPDRAVDAGLPISGDDSLRFLIATPDDLDLQLDGAAALAAQGIAELAGGASAEPLFRTGMVSAAPTIESWSAELQGFARPPVLSGFVAALLLCLVALVAAAGFATGARRRIRQFGLLATVGASPAHLRRLVLVEAAMLGLVGAVVGVVIGVVAAPRVTPLAQVFAWQTIDDMRVAPLDTLGPVLAAVLGGVLAAWFPARTVARAPVLGALAGRVPQRPLSPRAVPSGVALLCAGLAVVGAGAAGIREEMIGGTSASFVMVFGSLLCLGGAALVGTFVAGRVGAHADRLPLGFRLVARDAARQQFRTAVSIAGLVIVLAAPVMVVAGVRSFDATNGPSYSPALADEIVIDLIMPVPEGVVSTSADDEVAAQVAATVAVIDDIVPVEASGTLVGLTPASTAGTASDAALVMASGEAQREGYSGWSVYGRAAFGTPDAVASLRLPPSAAAALADGDAVALGSGVWSMDLLSSADGTTIDTIDVVPADRPATFSAPAVLIPPAMAERLGLMQTTRPFQLVIDLERPLDAEDRDRIWAALSDPELSLQDAGINMGVQSTPAATTAQAIAIPVGIALVLIIGGCLVAVAATESDRDIATMVRVGAAPSLRRRFLALQGWYHATLAALLGAPIGILLVVALRQAVHTPTPVSVPWFVIAMVVVAAPAALAAVVALSVRSITPTS